MILFKMKPFIYIIFFYVNNVCGLQVTSTPESQSQAWNYLNFISLIQNYLNPTANPIINANVQFVHAPPATNYFGPKGINSYNNNNNNNIGTSKSKNPWTCDRTKPQSCTQELPYRSFDGSCNNLENPTWGMAKTRYARLLPPIYSDGIWQPAVAKSGRALPRSRVLSYTLFPELRVKDPKWTLATMQFGQIVTHDTAQLATAPMLQMESVECCTNDDKLVRKYLNDPSCFPILLGPDDPNYDPRSSECLTFTRAAADFQIPDDCYGQQKSADQITLVTQFLDLSVLYGSSESQARNLRKFQGGKMRTQIRRQREWLPPANPVNVTGQCVIETQNHVCYDAGDNRVNQNPQLTVLQILLVREHNRIATNLARINPHWNDETIYQETRRIAIASYQQITYYEWLPAIIGLDNALKYKLIYDVPDTEYINDYSPNVDPTVLNEHSNGAFRVFHSLIAGYLKLVQENRVSRGLLRLSDWFMRPGIIEQADNMDDLTRGLADQPEQARDEYYDHEVTLYLFRGNSKLGGDLRSTDIQRARDHGLASYNDYREFCKIPRAKTWADFSDYISPENVKKLAQLYEHPDDVDFAVGGGLEVNTEGALAGPTFLCVLIEQFYRSRVGDRYWFESPDPVVAFTREQLREIRKSTLARFMCDNSDSIKSLQRHAFKLPSLSNPIVPCDSLPSIDFSFWKDFAPQLANQQQHLGILYRK
ncbi:peroxidase [Microplitis demolitor]|uniref:peroxidase n=1 Tax=Microplitis demolitor TaxID=69319 RepID=UPI00235B6666|nr:peroxidase [Microplitis demolitor]